MPPSRRPRTRVLFLGTVLGLALLLTGGYFTSRIWTGSTETGPRSPAATVEVLQSALLSSLDDTPPNRSRVDANAYVVDVASQASEADARLTYQMLQNKYGSVLGDFRPTIKRADFGDWGGYYRVQVGPFSKMEDASRVCTSLKALGGQCVVRADVQQ